jgi:hypothetical protein
MPRKTNHARKTRAKSRTRELGSELRFGLGAGTEACAGGTCVGTGRPGGAICEKSKPGIAKPAAEKNMRPNCRSTMRVE